MIGINPPLKVAKGFAGTELGGTNKHGGTFQIETLTANPMDGFVNSRAETHWSSKSTWLGMGDTITKRDLLVEDKDSSADLHVTLEKTPEGKSELAIHNGSGARATELRFDLGTLQNPGVAEKLAQAKGPTVKAEYYQKGDQQQATISVGDFTCLFT